MYFYFLCWAICWLSLKFFVLFCRFVSWMWTRKCSQCIALLHWDCKRGKLLKCQRNNSKNKVFFSFFLQLMSNLVWKSGKIVMLKTKRNFCFSVAHNDFKTKSFCWMGYLLWARRHFELGLTRRRGCGFQSGRNMSFQKEKKNHWGQTECYCHTSTVLFVSFNFSIRNGLLFHSGHLRVERAECRTTHVVSLKMKSVPTGF